MRLVVRFWHVFIVLSIFTSRELSALSPNGFETKCSIDIDGALKCTGTAGNALYDSSVSSACKHLPSSAFPALPKHFTIIADVTVHGGNIAGDGRTIFARYDSRNNQRSFALDIRNGELAFAVSYDGASNEIIGSGYSIPIGDYDRPLRVSFVFHNESYLFGVNQKLVARGTLSPRQQEIFASAADHTLGCVQYSNQVDDRRWNGQIKSVQLKLRAMSAQELGIIDPNLSGLTTPTPTATRTPNWTPTSTPTATPTATPQPIIANGISRPSRFATTVYMSTRVAFAAKFAPFVKEMKADEITLGLDRDLEIVKSQLGWIATFVSTLGSAREYSVSIPPGSKWYAWSVAKAQKSWPTNLAIREAKDEWAVLLHVIGELARNPAARQLVLDDFYSLERDKSKPQRYFASDHATLLEICKKFRSVDPSKSVIPVLYAGDTTHGLSSESTQEAGLAKLLLDPEIDKCIRRVHIYEKPLGKKDKPTEIERAEGVQTAIDTLPGKEIVLGFYVHDHSGEKETPEQKKNRLKAMIQTINRPQATTWEFYILPAWSVKFADPYYRLTDKKKSEMKIMSEVLKRAAQNKEGFDPDKVWPKL